MGPINAEFPKKLNHWRQAGSLHVWNLFPPQILGTGHEKESGDQYRNSGVWMRGLLSSKACAWHCLALIKLKEASVPSVAPWWTIWPWTDLPRHALNLVCLVWCPQAVHLLAALYQLLPPLEAAWASHRPRQEKNRDAWLWEGFVCPITLPSSLVWLLLRCCHEEVFCWPPWDTSRWPRRGENTGGWAMLVVLQQSQGGGDKGCANAAVVLGDHWEEGEEDPWHFLLGSEPVPAQKLLPWFGHVTEASFCAWISVSWFLWFCSYF